MKYKHLSLEEREKFYALKEQGFSLREIGRRLKRSHTTLSREPRRNAKYGVKYIPCRAQRLSDKRALKQRYKAPLKNPTVFLHVRKHLRGGWTPDEIAGRLPLIHPGESISYETIYRYIYSRKMVRFHYWQYLTLGRKKRMKKNGRSIHRDSKIPEAKSIDLRPEIVNLRTRVGDWETDGLEGKRDDVSVISTTIERLTRLTLLNKLNDRCADTKTNTVARRLLEYPKNIRLTLTQDNGPENSYHKQLSKLTGLEIFFCHTYHSWEKGSVENMNSRIRRYLPKGTSLDQISEKQIQEIEHRLNSTPRKCLGYLTPYEKMSELISGIT